MKTLNTLFGVTLSKKSYLFLLEKKNLLVDKAYHCKRSEPEKKSLIIKIISLPSSSLLLTDHFSLCHTSLTCWPLHFIFCFLTAAEAPLLGEERVR